MAGYRVPRWGIVVLAALIMGGGYWTWRGATHVDKNAKAHAVPQPVPVTVAPVEKADFPVYLLGLGTVQGFNTVVVRTRVDGQIDKILFKEGQFVEKGELLAQIDPRVYQAALDQAIAKKNQDEAALANARLDLQRSTKLGDFATRQQVDTQRSTVQQLTAQIAADEAAIVNAQTQLDYASIRAPIAGITGLRQVDVGNIVNAATQTGIVTIVQIEPISVIFTAPEHQLPDVAAALARGPVKVIAYTSDGRNKLSEGKLALVNNQVDTTSGTIRLKATFDNKDRKLWPGLSVATRLLVNTVKDAIMVPDEAVKHGVDGLYVFTVGGDDKAQLRSVEAGPSGSGRTLIESGLALGERVVTRGQYRVHDGASLSVQTANAAEASGTD